MTSFAQTTQLDCIARVLVAGEMTDAKVQAYGDVAILTINSVGVTQDTDGETEPMPAKSTREYVKQNGSWKLVHANFAPVSGDE